MPQLANAEVQWDWMVKSLCTSIVRKLLYYSIREAFIFIDEEVAWEVKEPVKIDPLKNGGTVPGI